MVVGIIGMGYVGTACYEGFREHVKVETYDIDLNKNPTCKSIDELCDKSNILFVCVPTPSMPDGDCDTRIVERVISEINEYAISEITKSLIVVIKSTVKPVTTRRFHAMYPLLKVCFNPEFLTEANWKSDFLSQEYAIVGYDDDFKHVWEVAELYRISLHIPVYFVTSTEAEMIKYISNIFLASKVSLMNEFYSIVQHLNTLTPTKWDNIRNILMLDERIGETHLKVPGPDGHYGFGGTCFPKDIQALIQFASELGEDTPIMNAVWQRNITMDRAERDWEKDIGRAISKN